MKNYSTMAAGYVRSLSAAEKKTFAYAPGAARDRCSEKGLFQGRTPDSPDRVSTERGKSRRQARGK